jgi:hypothetical protein
MELADGSGQRACVDGFCTEDTRTRLLTATSGTDLVTLSFRPGGVSDGQVVVTLDEGDEFTWLGSPLDTANIDHHYREDLSESGLQALHAAWQVQIIDPVWGRNDLLWDALHRFADTHE